MSFANRGHLVLLVALRTVNGSKVLQKHSREIYHALDDSQPIHAVDSNLLSVYHATFTNSLIAYTSKLNAREFCE